jgi:hypothetical protein
MPEQPYKPTAFPNSALEESPESGDQEKRKNARYAFTAAVEICDLASKARLTGRCSDIGLGGCYVDTLAPLHVGSLLAIRIEQDESEFVTLAVVAFAHRSMGMGLKFTEMKPEHRELLRRWVANLGTGNPAKFVEIEANEEAKACQTESDIVSALSELIALLVRKKILTDSEAVKLLPRIIG